MFDFAYKIMIQKGMKRASKALVAMLIATTPMFKHYGIDISVNEAVLSAVVLMFMEMGLNYLKNKMGVKIKGL